MGRRKSKRPKQDDQNRLRSFMPNGGFDLKMILINMIMFFGLLAPKDF
jgi:hypothetical protein